RRANNQGIAIRSREDSPAIHEFSCLLKEQKMRRLLDGIIVLWGVAFPEGGAPWQSTLNPSHFGEGRSKTSPALSPMSLKISGTSTCMSLWRTAILEIQSEARSKPILSPAKKTSRLRKRPA